MTFETDELSEPQNPLEDEPNPVKYTLTLLILFFGIIGVVSIIELLIGVLI